MPSSQTAHEATVEVPTYEVADRLAEQGTLLPPHLVWRAGQVDDPDVASRLDTSCWLRERHCGVGNDDSSRQNQKEQY